jgi:hypothetical protein
MRSLTPLFLALCALALPAAAETGPNPEELARAKADCAAKVRQDCLLTLAIETARTGPEAELLLNEIAFLQATAGDKAGAERTLSLTTPGFLALLALGREAEAQVAFEALMLGPGVTMSKAKPPDPGEVALEKVEELVADGKIDEALATALALTPDHLIEQSKALRLIVDHHLARNDFAAAARVAKQMNATQDQISAQVVLTFNYSYTHPRADALVAVVKAQAASGDLAGAAALVGGLVDPRTLVNARIALADGYFRAGRKTEAITQLDLILASVQRLELSNHFGLAELTASADLAFRNGETEIARQHAELAYKTLLETQCPARRRKHVRHHPPDQASAPCDSAAACGDDRQGQGALCQRLSPLSRRFVIPRRCPQRSHCRSADPAWRPKGARHLTPASGQGRSLLVQRLARPAPGHA